MRNAFINTLFQLAKKDKNIFLLNGDLGFSVLEKFNEAYPKRAWNMGVAEANMIGAAAGLAMSGKTVFVYSIIPFVTFRVFEQIRNDVAMQNVNVKIVGVGSGLSYGSMGATHHAIEDIAVMRVLPNMTVVCPGDPQEAVEATKAIAQLNGPAYLRINTKGDPIVHREKIKFILGKAIVISSGRDLTLIATGNMLPVADQTANELKKNGLSVNLISMPTIKPLDKAIIQKIAKTTKAIFTLEEHNILGGLGSAVAEVLAESGFHGIFRRFGLVDCFTYFSGSRDALLAYHGLTSVQIANKIKSICSKK